MKHTLILHIISPHIGFWAIKVIFVTVQNVCNRIDWNSVHISDMFICYSANVSRMWNVRKLAGIFKTSAFTLTLHMRLYSSYGIQAAKFVSRPNWVKIEVLLYEVPCIISYAEFSGESISGIINAKSSFIWSIFQFFHQLCSFHFKSIQWKSSLKRFYKI